MGRDNRRWLVGALCAITAALAVALLIGLQVEPRGSLAQWSEWMSRSVWPRIWHSLRSPGRKGWATIVQLIGAVVTFLGLWTAWVRAKHGVTVTGLVKRLWAWTERGVTRILGLRRDVIIPASAATTILIGGTPTISVTFGLDERLSTDENLKRLAQFVNRLSDNTIPQIEQHIVKLRGEIKDVRAHASELATQTVARLQDQIDDLRRDLDATQVLDLRWAIYGLLITVFGIALSYGT